MALKGDRNVRLTDVTWNMNEVATRGGIVVVSTGGSGAALDQSAALVTYAAAQSGKLPIGLLLGDMVNYDLTKQHINWHKDETQLGGKVPVMRQGWVVTSFYVGSPTAGQFAYLGPSGYMTTVQTNGANNPIVGQFLSSPDQDNYVKVEINMGAGTT